MTIDGLRSMGLPIERTHGQWGLQFRGPSYWFCPSEGGLSARSRAMLRAAGFNYGHQNVNGKTVRGWSR